MMMMMKLKLKKKEIKGEEGRRKRKENFVARQSLAITIHSVLLWIPPATFYKEVKFPTFKMYLRWFLFQDNKAKPGKTKEAQCILYYITFDVARPDSR